MTSIPKENDKTETSNIWMGLMFWIPALIGFYFGSSMNSGNTVQNEQILCQDNSVFFTKEIKKICYIGATVAAIIFGIMEIIIQLKGKTQK